MSGCVYHGKNCAFQTWSEVRCEVCHCDWAKITAPATRITTRQGVNRKGEPTTVEHTAYLDGYGETPLNHLWRHAVDLLRAEAGAARKARVAAKRRAA